MARGSVARSVRELGHLVTVTPGDPSRQMASQYRLNIEIPEVELVSLCNQQLVSKRDQASLLASRIKRPSKESPKKKRSADPFFPIIEKIIGRINELSGKAYKAETKAVCKYLRARLEAGGTEADCLVVVEDRWARWGESERMRENFNPVTLFREEHFARYLVEAQASRGGTSSSLDQGEWRKRTFINA